MLKAIDEDKLKEELQLDFIVIRIIIDFKS